MKAKVCCVRWFLIAKAAVVVYFGFYIGKGGSFGGFFFDAEKVLPFSTQLLDADAVTKTLPLLLRLVRVSLRIRCLQGYW